MAPGNGLLSLHVSVSVLYPALAMSSIAVTTLGCDVGPQNPWIPPRSGILVRISVCLLITMLPELELWSSIAWLGLVSS